MPSVSPAIPLRLLGGFCPASPTEFVSKFLFADLGCAQDRVLAIDELHASCADLGCVSHFGGVDERDDWATSGSAHELAALTDGRNLTIRTNTDEYGVDWLLG
jgi:hypothetical protein